MMMALEYALQRGNALADPCSDATGQLQAVRNDARDCEKDLAVPRRYFGPSPVAREKKSSSVDELA